MLIDVAVVDPLRQGGILRKRLVRTVAAQLHEFVFRDRLDLVLFGVDQGHEDRDRDDEDNKRDQVEGLEDALGDGHHGPGHLLNKILGVLGSGDDQLDGPREPHVPDHVAAVGGGDQEGEVRRPRLLGDLECQEPAHDQAEAPVDERADPGHEGDDHPALDRGVPDPGDPYQNPVDSRGERQAVAGHQDQDHLEGEGDDAVNPSTPGRDQFLETGVRENQGQNGGKEREQDREQIGVGKVVSHQVREKRSQTFQHR